MNNLKDFIKSFFSNKGQYVFVSLLVAKICGFISSVAVVRILSREDYGIMTLVASVFTVFATVSGFGSTQGLLRFGAVSEDEEQKDNLAQYFFYRGFMYQIFLSIIFLVCGFFFALKYENIFFIFIFFTIRLIGFYFFLYIQSYYRIHHNNKGFASVNNYVNIIGVILIIVLSYFFGLVGYLWALAVAPFLSLFWFFKLKIFKLKKISLPEKELWSYSIHAVITALLSDFLFSLDILLLGFMLSEKEVANYKVAIILPSNLTFLALSMLQADFSKIAQHSKNKEFLKNYILNYYKIFIPVCLLIFFLGSFFSSQILNLFFGKTYAQETPIFIVLLFAFLMNILFRNLYGNLLSAIGKIKFNTVISFITLILLFIGAFVLVPAYKILGMGISITLAMATSGFLALLFFMKYFKEI